MSRPAADSVKVEWTGTGQGTLTLGSNVSGYAAFPAAADGLPVSYEISHQTATERENGVGTYSSGGNTLTRDVITFSTAGGTTKVNFSAGTKHVRLVALSLDMVEDRRTSNPGVNDDITTGYIRGRSRVLNTSTDTLWFCVDDTDGAAVWVQAGGGAGAVSSVNGQTGAVSIDAANINAVHSPINYSQVGSPSGDVESALAGIDAALGALAVGADATPATDPNVTGATYTLDPAYQMHTNGDVQTTQASQRFNVPAATPARRRWLIYPKHDNCLVGVVGDAGSINGVAGSTEQLVNGGVVIVEVDSNPGSAPVVFVRGDVILLANQVAGTKTYDNEDHGQDFDLTSGAGTQTFGAVANFPAGYYVNIFNGSGGSITIDGLDADVSLPNLGAILVRKHTNGALWATGTITGGTIVLDAA